MKPRSQLVCALAGPGIALTAWLLSPAQQLRRQVNHWVHEFEWTSAEFTLQELESRQVEALRRLGPEVGPLLLADTRKTQSRTARRWAEWRQRHSAWLPQAFRPPINSDPWAVYRRQAAQALSALGKEAPVSVAEVLAMAESSLSGVRWEALDLLGAKGIWTLAVSAALDRQLADPDDRVPALAARYRLQPDDLETRSQLTVALLDPSPSPGHHFHAVYGQLGTHGPGRAPASPGAAPPLPLQAIAKRRERPPVPHLVRDRDVALGN